MLRLQDKANMKQTQSTCRARVNLYWIRLLHVCFIV